MTKAQPTRRTRRAGIAFAAALSLVAVFVTTPGPAVAGGVSGPAARTNGIEGTGRY
ncbi:hypothetical protein [Actinokineospora enzanensis]|uniref:hypothetical protein n=1 Tax=Actinokineospora enzanensis TaxID=155975 RepID=UPI00037A9219|nr:hypothetical protein [Actinokineospora enzanensis]